MKLNKDLEAFAGNSIKKRIITILINPCFHSVCLFRLSSILYKKHLVPLAKIVWYLNRVIFNVDIDYRANLAGGLLIIHGLGIVIGESVKSLGKLTVFQGVTIGGTGKSKKIGGDEVQWQPILEDGCILYTNAIVLGPIVVKENSRIYAGVRITQDYPE